MILRARRLAAEGRADLALETLDDSPLRPRRLPECIQKTEPQELEYSSRLRIAGHPFFITPSVLENVDISRF